MAKEVFMKMNFFHNVIKSIVGLVLMTCLIFPTVGAPLMISSGDLDSKIIEMDLIFNGELRTFQVDTGANSSLVTLYALTQKYPSVGKSKIEGAAGISTSCDIINIENVIFDEFIFNDQNFLRCDFEGKQTLNNLGLDFFKKHMWSFNFENKSLSILNESQFEENKHFYPIKRLEKGHIIMDSKIGNQLHQIVFDTGAQLTTVDLKFIEKNIDDFQYLGDTDTVKDIGGNSLSMKLYRLKSMQVGEVNFQQLTVLAFDFGKKLREYLGERTPVIFGANAITQANWVLDFEGNKFSVEEYDHLK